MHATLMLYYSSSWSGSKSGFPKIAESNATPSLLKAYSPK